MKVSRFIFAAICGLIVAASCDKVENDQKGNEFVFNLIPTVETTKTAMNAAGTDVVWQEDVMEAFVNGYYSKPKIKGDGTFDATIGNTTVTAGTYKVQGFLPASAFVQTVKNVDKNAVQVYKLNLPSTQNPTANSFDAAADVLVARLSDVNVTVDDIAAGTKSVSFYFGRIGAITKIALNRNSSTSISADEKVKRVEIEFPDAVKVAGNFCFDATLNKFVSTSNASDNTVISDLRNVFSENATSKLTVEYPASSRPSIDNLDVWAVVPPVTVNANETIKFTIYTEAHTIEKTATPTQAISFSNQQLNTLSLNLSTATVGDPEPDYIVVKKTMTELKESNSNWTISTSSEKGTYVTLFNLDDIITVSTSGNPDCGTIWGSSPVDWRLYQNKDGDVTVSAASGYSLVSVKFKYSVTNTGVLKYTEKTVGSEEELTCSGSSITLNVGNTGTATNGTVRITEFTVKYLASSSGDTPSEETYSIALDQSIENGSVAAEINGVAVSSAKVGTVISVVATPSAGYKLGEWDVRDASNKVINVTDGKFTMPASNVTVSASFEAYSISVSPKTASLGYAETDKTFTVTTNTTDWSVAIEQEITWATIKSRTNNSFVLHVDANMAEGQTTVDRSLTLVLSSNQYVGENVKVSVSQSGKEFVGELNVYTFAFNENNLESWPTSASNGDYTFSVDGEEYTFTLQNCKYVAPNTGSTTGGYLMLYHSGDGSGNKTIGSIKLPVLNGKKLVKVMAFSRSGASTGVKVGISCDPFGKEVVSGGSSILWSTSAKEYVYNLSDTYANEPYYLFVTEKNAQINYISLKYEDAEPRTLTGISLSGEYPTSFFVGDSFDSDGIVVTANYDTGNSRNVTYAAQFSGFNSAEACTGQIITVSYKGVSTTYTIDITEKVYYTITGYSSDNGSVTAKTSALEGESITLTVSPKSGYQLKDNSLKVFKTGDESTTVSVTNNSFTMPAYAVTISAEFEESGLTEYTLTINKDDFSTTSYAANNKEHTSTAVAQNGSTIQVKWTSNQIMQSSSTMQWQKSNAYLYNSTDLGTIKSVTVYSTAGTFTKYYGTSEHPTSGTTVGNGFFTVKVGSSATGKTSSIVVVFTK